MKSLNEHARGEFACHKQCDLNEDGVFEEKPKDKSAHCAGALIFLEQRNQPHQMMRICERLGMYDPSKLDMDAPVATCTADLKRKLTASATQEAP